MPHIQGAVALVTCHRSEIYVETDNPERAVTSIRSYFRSPSFHALVADAPDALQPDSPTTVLRDADSVRQLFRVAAGLDSAFVGEQEILGQVRRAYRIARDQRTLTARLDGAWQRAIALGRTVRTQAGFQPPRRSYAREAIRILTESLGTLQGRSVAVVGAGDAARGVAIALRNQELHRFFVLNRGAVRGRRLARHVKAEYRPLGKLEGTLREVDAAVVALRSEQPVIRLPAESQSRPSVVVDLSNPTVVRGQSPRLWTFNQIIERMGVSHQPSSPTLRRIETMVEVAAAQFMEDAWNRPQPNKEVLRRLNATAERVATRELEKALSRLGHLAPRDKETVRELARSLRTKLLMAPTLAMKEAAPPEREAIARAAAWLFGISQRDAGGAKVE